jgi:Zn-finger nucleic acid-binding protein
LAAEPVRQAPAAAPPAYAPEYRQPWGDAPGQGHYKSHGHYKKRKSWLEEIFD